VVWKMKVEFVLKSILNISYKFCPSYEKMSNHNQHRPDKKRG
jgi:hypothetical protein